MAKPKFRIGDVVQYTGVKSAFAGKVIDVGQLGPALEVRVQWVSGYCSWCLCSHLELVSSRMSLEKMLKECLE